MAAERCFLLYGIMAALFERNTSGKGQVVDAAMIDGVPAMMGMIHGMVAQGLWTKNREDNFLDGAAHPIMVAIKPRMNTTYLSGRLNRSFSRNSSGYWNWIGSFSSSKMTGVSGRKSNSCSPILFRPGPVTNGRHCLKAQMPVLRQYWILMRPPPIRTIGNGGHF